MELTVEMITKVDNEVHNMDNIDLRIYNQTYKELNTKYPNNYYKYMFQKSSDELQKRGLGQKTSRYKKHHSVSFEIGDIIKNKALDMYYIVYDVYWYEGELSGYIVYSMNLDQYNVHINLLYEYQYEKVV